MASSNRRINTYRMEKWLMAPEFHLSHLNFWVLSTRLSRDFLHLLLPQMVATIFLGSERSITLHLPRIGRGRHPKHNHRAAIIVTAGNMIMRDRMQDRANSICKKSFPLYAAIMQGSCPALSRPQANSDSSTPPQDIHTKPEPIQASRVWPIE